MRRTDFAGSAKSNRGGMSGAGPFGPFRSVRLVAACAQAPWAPPAKPQMTAVEAAIACRRSKVIGAIGRSPCGCLQGCDARAIVRPRGCVSALAAVRRHSNDGLNDLGRVT